MSRKFMEQVPDSILERDLEKYRKQAVELGATEAKVIPASQVVIDERVRAKCLVPKCEWYGTNANCPPHTMDVELMRRITGKYRFALFTMVQFSAGLAVGKTKEEVDVRRRISRQNHEMISRLEAEAFYDGYHLAMGFPNGTCKYALCPQAECSALQPGQGCRHFLRARPSMEAVGIDAYVMAARAGWEVYPIGRNTSTTDVPHGIALGLVLIY